MIDFLAGDGAVADDGAGTQLYITGFSGIGAGVILGISHPTAAINATLAGVISGAIKSDIIEKIYGMKNGIDGLLREDLIELNEIFSDKSKIKMLMTTPAAALGSCRRKLPTPDAKDYESVFSKIQINHKSHLHHRH